jgi:hypothetical protein
MAITQSISLHRFECPGSLPLLAGLRRQDSASKRGVRLFAHWTVMPSRRIIAMNPDIEMKIAIAVSP